MRDDERDEFIRESEKMKWNGGLRHMDYTSWDENKERLIIVLFFIIPSIGIFAFMYYYRDFEQWRGFFGIGILDDIKFCVIASLCFALIMGLILVSILKLGRSKTSYRNKYYTEPWTSISGVLLWTGTFGYSLFLSSIYYDELVERMRFTIITILCVSLINYTFLYPGNYRDLIEGFGITLDLKKELCDVFLWKTLLKLYIFVGGIIFIASSNRMIGIWETDPVLFFFSFILFIVCFIFIPWVHSERLNIKEKIILVEKKSPKEVIKKYEKNKRLNRGRMNR